MIETMQGVDADKNAFDDAMRLMAEWTKGGQRSITMFAQLACVAAMHFDGEEAGSVLRHNIDMHLKEVAN